MKAIVRPLVLLNVLGAVAFAMPLAIWIVVSAALGSSLKFVPQPPLAIARDIEEIRGIKDLERLRQRTLMLEQALDFERRTREVDAVLLSQLSSSAGLLLGVAAAGFLLNAGLLAWALRRPQPQP